MATLAQLLIELKNTQTTLDEFGAIKIKELKEQIFECDANLKGFELVRESLKESLDEEKNRLKELKKERMDLLNAMIKDANREPKTKPEPPKSVEVKLPEKQMLENRSKKSQPPSKVIKDVNQEPPKIRPEPPKIKPEPPKAKPEPPKTKSEAPKIRPEPPKIKPEPPKTKPEPPKIRPEPPKIKPEPPKAKPEPPKTKPEPPKIRPEPPKIKPESPKAKPEPPKSVEVKLPEKQVLENGSKKSQPPSKVIKDVNQEPPKTKSEPPKTTEVKLPEKEVIDLVLISDSSDSPNHIDFKKTKELTCKVLENGLKNNQPPSNMIQPPKKKMNPGPVNTKESTCQSPAKRPFMVQPPTKMNLGPVNAKESTCRSPARRPFMVQPPTKMNPGPVNAKESACRSPAKRPFMVQPKPNLSRKQKQLQAQAKGGKQPRDDKMIQWGNYPWGEPRYYKFSCEGKPLNRKDMVKWRTQVSKEKRKFEPGPFQCLCAQCGPKRSDSRFTGSNNAINKHHAEVYKPKFSCVRCGYYAATFYLNVIKGHLRKHEMDKEYI
ncbi:uncharacterized protein LOC128396278 [Panonychus citri]|uniref:uncharacterized protein LOC128396278 n=1 Tax=Panonychus citri TaxID=50023 RepID=UPI002307253E|nr:uncharacterized protein LOC128396278 [Panonychus citri]